MPCFSCDALNPLQDYNRNPVPSGTWNREGVLR